MNRTTGNGPLHAKHTPFRDTSTADIDFVAPSKKLSSLPTFQALPGRILLRTNHDHMDLARPKQALKSLCDLDPLLREAHKISTYTFAASSASKLDQQHWKSERHLSTKNAVFEVHNARRRRPLASRNGLANRRMRKELLLDDMGSLHRRLAEYRRQVKSKTFIPAFDSDSDEDDLE